MDKYGRYAYAAPNTGYNPLPYTGGHAFEQSNVVFRLILTITCTNFSTISVSRALPILTNVFRFWLDFDAGTHTCILHAYTDTHVHTNFALTHAHTHTCHTHLQTHTRILTPIPPSHLHVPHPKASSPWRRHPESHGLIPSILSLPSALFRNRLSDMSSTHWHRGNHLGFNIRYWASYFYYNHTCHQMRSCIRAFHSFSHYEVVLSGCFDVKMLYSQIQKEKTVLCELFITNNVKYRDLSLSLEFLHVLLGRMEI